MKWPVSWDNATNRERAEMVFANRNKEYGAYQIRRNYEKRIINALLYTLIIVGLPVLFKFLANSAANKKQVVSEEISLTEPPPIDKNEPPPPPVIPPPPVVQTIKFTPPKVVKDEEVQDEPPPTQEEMKDVQISTETHEGTTTTDLPPENPVVADPDEGKIFTIVEEQPTFPGGEEKLIEYIQKNTKYPAVARENGVQGKVFVNFVVDADGSIVDAKIIRSIGAGCDEEALRVVKSMPKWKAGRQNGRSVKCYFNLPVNFTLR
jgi:protein TonB